MLFPSTAPCDSREMPVTALVDEDRARGQVYTLLGHLLAGPPDVALLESLRGAAPEPGDTSLLAASWEMLAVAAMRAEPSELRPEYEALFIGLGRGEVVPYGSWYLTGFLMEQPLAQLRSDLRALGIERQPGVVEPEDHAAALCDTMALLILGEEPVPLEEQQAFFARHLEPWMTKFFRDLQQAGSARFYRAVGQLGEQFIGVESEAFGVSIPAAGTTSSN
jgi:TorA maturation chaperone TorD